jgi:arylsulfatase A-like enzyme
MDFARRLGLIAFVVLVVFGEASVFAQKESALSTKRRPNVLIILADDLGFSDLGCYGAEIETPNLDALAKNGLRFTNFYNTGRCWPTRGALLTGYYPQQIRRDTVPGVKSGSQGVRPGWAVLLPEWLQLSGYRTYHSGKWHIDGRPLENGFDHSYDLGGASQSNYFKTQSVTDDGKPVPQTEGYYSTVAVADHAVRCLREHAEKYADRPFFHYLCFTAPHFPLHALPEDIQKYRDRYRDGWNEIQKARFARQKELGLVTGPLPEMEREVGPPYAFPAAMQKLGAGEVNRPLPWAELTKEQQEFQAAKMAIHAAMIDRMDVEIGKVLAQIKAMNQFENTLIFFLSDNGASAEIMVRGDGHDPSAPLGSAATFPCLGPGWSSCSNTPFRRHKTWVHEGGISTPLIVHWPAGIAAKGEWRHTPGHVIDLFLTIFQLTGPHEKAPERPEVNVQPLPRMRSLAPVFAKDPENLNSDTEGRELWWLHEGNRALRRGKWKIVAAKGQPWDLYDLSNDRGETKNLAATYPDLVKELASRWEEEYNQFCEDAVLDSPRQ